MAHCTRSASIGVILGSMRCVNKILFLQPENVKVLGGEVEKLSIENAYENVLLKAMGRPITSTPKLDYKGQWRKIGNTF